MALRDTLEGIFARPRLGEDDFSQSEAIEELIPIHGWEAICDAILNILIQTRPMTDYELAAEVLWHGVCDRRPMPADKVIALLYLRFDPKGTDEDNLVWSIVSELRGVGYMSDYLPLEDPRVQQQLAIIKTLCSNRCVD